MLESIGLDVSAESAYRALISNPEWTLADLADHLGLPEDEVRRLLDHLVELSLLRSSRREAGRFRPVSPELGLMNLLAQSQVELMRREKQIQEARVAIAAMTDEYRARRAREHAVSQLEGQDAAHDRLAELTGGVRREYLSFLPAGARSSRAERQALREALDRGVAIRNVLRESARNDPAALRYVRDLAEAGGQTRTAPELPLQMAIADRETALIRMPWGALEVRGEGLLAGLIALFEQTWQAAAPFAEAPGPDSGEPTPLERALLRLLAQGCTDESAAKRLGVSLRTVRRMTAALLERLDARGRFQAGVRAAQLGWLLVLPSAAQRCTDFKVRTTRRTCSAEKLSSIFLTRSPPRRQEWSLLPHGLYGLQGSPEGAREKALRIGADTLTVEDVADVARRESGLAFEFDAAEQDRIERSVALKNRLIETGQPIYGVTTGFGDSNTHQISPRKAAELQRNLIVYHLVGSGPLTDPAIVRATMLVRANCLARGYSGIRASVIRLLLDCLAHDILPIVPERGSVGASGDLVPLCYLAAMLTGEGDAVAGGEVRPAADLLAEHGLEPAELAPKEALALINGTSFMSAFAAQAVHEAAELAQAADVCTALCSEVLLGNRGHFDAVIHEQKPYPGQLRSARQVRELLLDSKLSRRHEQVLLANPELGERSYLRLEQAIQDRYSIRCAPHVIGVLYDTLEWARRWVEIEINSTNDNPLFDPDSGSVLNGGNFYGGHIGQAMDALKVAVASVGDLLDRQLALLVDQKFNNGLTPNLIPVFGDDDHDAGLHHGYKGGQIACSALAAEALKLSTPATVFSRSTEAHNQDKVSMGTIAARDARTITGLVCDITAIHLAALCQAADLRGRSGLGSGTRAAYDLVREHVPFLDRDRRLDTGLASLAQTIRSGALRNAVKAARFPS